MSGASDAVESEVAGILAQLDLEPPIADDALEQLVAYVATTYGSSLPDDYVAFLRTANGADGDLENGAPVVFWSGDLLAQAQEDSETEKWAPGMFIIGSDAGDALYGIDLRDDAPPERYVEMFDGLDWEMVMWRGRSFLDLLLYVGRPHASGQPGFRRLFGRLRKPRP